MKLFLFSISYGFLSLNGGGFWVLDLSMKVKVAGYLCPVTKMN